MENVKLNSKKWEEQDLEKLTKEELIARIKCIEAHNTQLKNIIAKTNHVPKKKSYKQKPFDFSKAHFRHVLLKFYYLGWDYHGFAVQEDTTNTIEYHLFDGLIRTCLIKDRESSNYHRCGRTDKGVSAFSQVISIDLRSRFPKSEQQNNLENELEYCKIINRVLPNNIQCVCWTPVSDEFSARFDCKMRTYKYFFPVGELNIQAMNAALSYIIGSHDFRNFCKMDVANGVVAFVRNIKSANIEIIQEAANQHEYSMCQLSLKGQAFLWHQVRCIVGILFLIGGNKEKPEVIKELLDVENNPRKPEYNMASEIPLNLFYCDYDDLNDWVYDYSALMEVISKLQAMWTISASQNVMMKSMLEDLENIYKSKNGNEELSYTSLSNCLLQGIKPKIYRPLMERQKCEGLEDRIQHFIKKRRLIVPENEEKRNAQSTDIQMDES